MRLVAIINAWADTIELLPYCIENYLKFCDGVIVVWSIQSNHGNYDDRMLEFIVKYDNQLGKVMFVQCEPIQGFALMNETRKRNMGIKIAIDQMFTHYIISDADEFYIAEEAQAIIDKYPNGCIHGLVCRLKVYVGKPTLWCDDHTLVPFIQNLYKDSYVGQFKEYPFAYDDKGVAHIDPSRRPNVTSGIEMCEIYMHHLSYVRKDISMKISNSSANLKRSEHNILTDIENAKPGWKSLLYHQELKECENIFNIEI